MNSLRLLLAIILAFAKIDILSFGGGYVSIPLVENEIVENQKWMNYDEFSNILAIDELTPGPVAINCATFVGIRLFGIKGAIAATLGSIIPSIILSLILIKVYSKYKNNKYFNGILDILKCMVVGFLASTFLNLFSNSVIIENSFNILSFIIFIFGLILLRKYKLSPVLMILSSGFISLIINFIIK